MERSSHFPYRFYCHHKYDRSIVFNAPFLGKIWYINKCQDSDKYGAFWMQSENRLQICYPIADVQLSNSYIVSV